MQFTFIFNFRQFLPKPPFHAQTNTNSAGAAQTRGPETGPRTAWMAAREQPQPALLLNPLLIYILRFRSFWRLDVIVPP